MSGPTPEQWRRIFLDGDEGPASEDRFLPLRSSKGLASAEHLARYLFAAAFCAGRRVLDIACGSGYGAYILKIMGAAEVIGVDSDAPAIAGARRHYCAEGVEFRVADATALDLDGAPFDLIVAFETLEHLEDPKGFLQSVKRHLAPGGLFIISCPNDARSLSVSPSHLRHYTYGEFRDLVGRYFPDPQPVSQLHAAASLVLPLRDAAADGLARHPLAEAYLEFSKSVEDSDAFLLLCGDAAAPQSTAVITKNLTEILQEASASVEHLRRRAPQLEGELAEARARIDRQGRQLLSTRRALEDQKAYTVELQQQLEELRYSRTWQLMLACRAALRSPGALLRLPWRAFRILVDPPAAPLVAEASGQPVTPVLPQYLPHRRSEILDWPADRPLVTIGIPCYNYGRFIREAIDSVVASTFQDFEIIVVNDGSTDPETLAVLEQFEKTPLLPGRLRVVHQQNQGLAAARNKGAALARGKYVISLDADDRIDPTYLEKTAWVLEHHPQYAFCYSYVQFFGADDDVWKTQPFSLEKALLYNHVPTGAVFRREAWVEAGGFRDELHGQDDWNFWITLGAKGWDGCLIPELLFFYRKHQTSMWSNIRMAERERIAHTIQQLHAYLTGKGDSVASEQFNAPKDSIVRAAIDQPEPPPAQPGIPLVRRPHLQFGNGRPGLLFAIPWMMIGGAEQVVLQVMQGLSGDYGLAAVTTLDVRHNWEEEFARLTPWIFHLAHLPIGEPAGYLRDFIEAHNIAALIVSSSALTYQCLPALKQAGDLWTADIVHNTVPEGYLDSSIRADRYLDCHFAVGPLQRDALIRKGGVDAEKIRVAPTSADAMRRFNPATYAERLPELRHRLGLQGGEIVLTYTGRLASEKDVPLFVRIAGEIVRSRPRKKFRAFIVGDGPERARVEHQIRAEGLQGLVEILGFCANPAEILAVSHFAFLTSRFEGSSITLLEAMSMRQVVLATDVGTARDVIEDGASGFIVLSRSPADFAARVAQVLDDPAREVEIRNRARQTVLDRYDLGRMVRVYADTIAEAVARRQPA